MNKTGPELLYDKAENSFIRAGEQCGPHRVAMKLAEDLNTANLKLQEAEEDKLATARAAFEAGYWAGRQGPSLINPIPDMEAARARFIAGLMCDLEGSSNAT